MFYLCKRKPFQLEAYKEKFGDVNVTFVGQRISVNSVFSAPSVLPKGVNIVDGQKILVK